MRGVSVSAFAKLNLHLQVFPRRGDGFHDIESLFVKVGLCDELRVCRRNEAGLGIFGASLPQKNTISRAFELFCESVGGISSGVNVELTKRIPQCAGLGGGSSDAAAMLSALNEIFDWPLSDDELLEIAVRIGSDVPFFMLADAAFVAGRGEKVRPIAARGDLFFLIAKPAVDVSTAWAYGVLDAADDFSASSLGFDAVLAEFAKSPREWRFFNDFQRHVCGRFPQISAAISAVRDAGADFVQMSGSGSAVFGVFSDEKIAKEAFSAVKADGCDCFLTLPVFH